MHFILFHALFHCFSAALPKKAPVWIPRGIMCRLMDRCALSAYGYTGEEAVMVNNTSALLWILMVACYGGPLLSWQAERFPLGRLKSHLGCRLKVRNCPPVCGETEHLWGRGRQADWDTGLLVVETVISDVYQSLKVQWLCRPARGATFFCSLCVSRDDLSQQTIS